MKIITSFEAKKEKVMQFENACNKKQKRRVIELQRNCLVLLLCWVLFVNLITCFSSEVSINKIEEAINNILVDNRAELANSILYLHSQGVVAIPYLIEKISSGQNLSSIDLHNPESSIYHFDNNYTGIILAYVIELILAEDKISVERLENGYLLLSSYLFTQGIVKKANTETIKSSDLDEFQKVYQRWWERSKHKSIDELRADYITKKPLKSSCFQWF